jgi:adenosylmethionine---8-amino-7-oxononanoate aminotransferase
MIQSLDEQYVWHPFTPQKSHDSILPIVRGEGTLLIDENGNSYIDSISSWWVNLHGHAHPYIAKKIYEQALKLEQVIFAGFTHEPAVILAQRLCALLPGAFSKIFYSDNGSTSTEVALKMSLQYWWNQGEKKRTKILALRNSYHGDTFGAMSVSDRGVFTLAFHGHLFEVIFIDPPTASTIDFAKATVQKHAEELAAFIYEPLVQGAGGLQMYEPTHLNELLHYIQGKDILCIADEVMTGFGRTGKLFASEYMHSKPDIICLSKGITGGFMPLGVTACNNRVYQAFLDNDPRKTFFHGHSYTANPLACAASLASLDLLESDPCITAINRICQYLQDFRDDLNGDVYTKTIKNVRQLGTILAFELISAQKDDYLNSSGKDFGKYCMQQGVYLRPLGNTVYVMPPYCITEEELKKVTTTILGALE